MQVPFFRPELQQAEIDEVVDTLRSGWLTSGPKTALFESEFAETVGASHAVAVNSCTAALHLASAALGLKRGQGVLVPTMTFAATAEIVQYAGALPVLVDCEEDTLNLDLGDAANRIADLRAGRVAGVPSSTEVVGIIPVHVGGLMLDMSELRRFTRQHDLWVIEDAAHAFPAAYRDGDELRSVGRDTADVSCFSFYANKTITTGEGGMAVTASPELAERMRSLSLHGLSNDAWGRYSSKGSWDYRILAPGYKYNLTDIAAALGLHQLRRAEALRQQRERIANRFLLELADVEEIQLPNAPEDRVHSWHLFQIKLHLDRLRIDRDAFLDRLAERGIGFSVHWRPLHLHPHYVEEYGTRPEDLPRATKVWKRTISLPIFPAMRSEEAGAVIRSVREICRKEGRAF